MRRKVTLLLAVLFVLATPAAAEIYQDVLDASERRAQGRISDADLIRYCTGVIENDISDADTKGLAYAVRSKSLLSVGDRAHALADAEASLEIAPEIAGGYQAMMDYALANWAFGDAAEWARQAKERAGTPEGAAYFAKMEQYCYTMDTAESISALLNAYDADKRAADRDYGGKEIYLRGPVKSKKRNMLRNSTVVELSVDASRVVRCEVITDTNAEVRDVMELKPGQEAILRGLPGDYSAKTLQVQESRLVTAR